MIKLFRILFLLLNIHIIISYEDKNDEHCIEWDFEYDEDD